MFKTMSMTLMLCLTFLFISCEKEILTVPESGDAMADDGYNFQGAKMNTDCPEYENFTKDFCYRLPRVEYPKALAVLSPLISNGNIFPNRGVELLVKDKSVKAELMTEDGSDYGFRVLIDNEEYFLLPKSKEELVNVEVIEVPQYLQALIIIQDDLLKNELNPDGIQNALGEAGKINGKNAEGQLVITIDDPSLLAAPGGGGPQALAFGCSWLKKKSIIKALASTGFSTSSQSPYYAYMEASLNACGYSCHACADPLCLLDEFRTYLSSQSDLDKVDDAFLRHGLSLTTAENIAMTDPINEEVRNQLLTYMEGDDFCTQVLVGAEIGEMLIDGVLKDACDANMTQQEMLLSVMNDPDFQDFDFDEFYLTLGEETDYIMRKHFDKCPQMNCILDAIIADGFCSEVIDGFNELEGEFDLIFQYDWNCNSSKFSYDLNYGPQCSFSGSQSDYATTLPRPNCFPDQDGVFSCNPFSLQLYNKHFCEALNPLKLAAIMIHETIHSEFHRWVYEAAGSTNLNETSFTYNSVLWNQVVMEKYGSTDIVNHHALINEYLVPQLAEDLWRLNGETDTNLIQNYYYLVYDLLAPDAQLVSLEFLTQAELDNYINLSNQLVSNIGCE